MSEENINTGDQEFETNEHEQDNHQEDNEVKLSKAEYEKMRQALAKANKEAQQRRQALKQWEDTGVDPDSIKELMEKQKEQEMRKAEEKGEFDKIRQQLLKQHEAKLSEKDQALNQMKSTLESYLVDNAAISAIGEFDGVPQLLLPHVKNQVRVSSEDGKYQVQVIDADGTPRVNANGEFLTIKELVSEMRSDPIYGLAFKAPKASGTGTNPNSSDKASRKGQSMAKPKAQWSQDEKASFIREQGIEAYRKHK